MKGQYRYLGGKSFCEFGKKVRSEELGQLKYRVSYFGSVSFIS